MSFGMLRPQTQEFLSTPSARRATPPPSGVGALHPISIHALREEGDADCSRSRRQAGISIHALREEGDEQLYKGAGRGEEFLSTPSARRATGRRRQGVQHQSISIHALREEGDCWSRSG